MTRKGRIAAPARKTPAELDNELLELELRLQSDLIGLEASIAEIDWRAKRRAAWPKEWRKIEDVFPTTPPKTSLTLRLDADMAAWFRGQGRGYQARMNAVLRAYMLARMTKLACSG